MTDVQSSTATTATKIRVMSNPIRQYQALTSIVTETSIPKKPNYQGRQYLLAWTVALRRCLHGLVFPKTQSEQVQVPEAKSTAWGVLPWAM
jgi:hypothetical protein